MYSVWEFNTIHSIANAREVQRLKEMSGDWEEMVRSRCCGHVSLILCSNERLHSMNEHVGR